MNKKSKILIVDDKPENLFALEETLKELIKEVTERKKTEEQVRVSLKEKEVLLKEVYHRVKNNMNMIISLLRLQSKNIKDKQYLDKFKECENRIKSMALIHEELYRTENLAEIDFAGYIRNLASRIFKSY